MTSSAACPERTNRPRPIDEWCAGDALGIEYAARVDRSRESIVRVYIPKVIVTAFDVFWPVMQPAVAVSR